MYQTLFLYVFLYQLIKRSKFLFISLVLYSLYIYIIPRALCVGRLIGRLGAWGLKLRLPKLQCASLDKISKSRKSRTRSDLITVQYSPRRGITPLCYLIRGVGVYIIDLHTFNYNLALIILTLQKLHFHLRCAMFKFSY